MEGAYKFSTSCDMKLVGFPNLSLLTAPVLTVDICAFRINFIVFLGKGHEKSRPPVLEQVIWDKILTEKERKGHDMNCYIIKKKVLLQELITKFDI